MSKTGGGDAADASSFPLLDTTATYALHRTLLVVLVDGLSDICLRQRRSAWNAVLIKPADDYLRGIPCPLLNFQTMSLHDELELREGGHVVLAALFSDDLYLLHDIACGGIESARVDTQDSVAFTIAVADREPVPGCNLRKQLDTSAVLLEIMDLTSLLVDPDGYHVEVFPVDIPMAVDDVRLASVAEPGHQFADEILYLLIGQTLIRGRIHRHMEGEIFSTDVAPLIEPEGILDAQRVVYAMLVDELRFSDGALLLVVFQGEAG